MGNLLAVHVHAANIHDTKGGVYTFEKALCRYPSIEAGCADEGYRGTFINTFEIFHNIRIDISKQIILISNHSIDKIHLLPVILLMVSLDREQMVLQSLSITF